MAVTRKEQIASGKKVTPLTREELRLAGKTFAPLTEEERFHKVAYSGGSEEAPKREETLIPEQSVTGTKPVPDYPYYIAALEGDRFERDEIKVYFDGTAYEVSLDSESGGYGAPVDHETGQADFSVYPFALTYSPQTNKWMMLVEDGDEHTVKAVLVIEATYPFGTITITENGLINYPVKEYEFATIDVPDKVYPFGKVQISVGTAVGFAVSVTSIGEKNIVENVTAQSGSPATINVTSEGPFYSGDTMANANGTFMVTVPANSPTIRFSKQESGGTLLYAKADETHYLVYVLGINKLNPVHITVLLE